MSVDLLWYGERGIVNAIVAALEASGVNGVEHLLRAVVWGNKSQPAWIGEIASVLLIVEIGCYDFGNPDLIIVCTTTSGSKYAVFVEAKVARYLSCTASNEKGMSRKKFNSSINGQLSLKFRLTQAISTWDGGACLAEPPAILKSYARHPQAGGLGDKSSRPRRLEKREVLSIFRSAGFANLPSSNCHIVALTWDREPFFSADDFAQSEFRPLFLSEDGTEQWEQVNSQIGWLGYGSIAESAALLDVLGAPYQQAVSTMFRQVIPPVVSDAVDPAWPAVTSYNINDTSRSKTVELLRKMEDLACHSFGRGSVRSVEGSTSVSPIDTVLIKLVPQNARSEEDEVIAMGISTSLARDEWSGHRFDGPKRFGRGANQRPFLFLELPVTEESLEVVDAMFAEIAEHLGLERIEESE
jgi:hypothetical protein